MRLILAIFLPWLQFFTIFRPISGVVCFILQLTIIGWIPAVIWSVYALSQYKSNGKIRKLKKEVKRNAKKISELEVAGSETE